MLLVKLVVNAQTLQQTKQKLKIALGIALKLLNGVDETLKNMLNTNALKMLNALAIVIYGRQITEMLNLPECQNG